MLQVIEKDSKIRHDRSQGTVVVRSSERDFQRAWHELSEGRGARDLATTFAARCGMSSPRINGNVGAPFAVNSDGMPLDQVRDDTGQPYEPTHPKVQPVAYQVEVPVTQPLL